MDGKCILVVEDEALIAMELEMSLIDAGYQVLGPVSTARKALDLVTETAPDFALIDINLADGRGTGIPLARTLRTEFGVPTLFLSGQVTEATANQDAALGLLRKPFSGTEVAGTLDAVHAVLEGKAPLYVPRGLDLFHLAQ